MKNATVSFYAALASMFVMSAGLRASADVTVGTTDLGLQTQIPGSGSDYDLFGGSNPTNLTDFSVSVLGNQYGGDGRYSTVTTPDGTTGVQTGITYNYGASNNLATVTLGNTSAYDYGDFNLYVTFGNEPGGGNDCDDADVYLIINGQTYNVPVVENKSDSTQAEVEEFNIQGLTAGDQITVGATKIVGDNVSYIGAVSFEEAPEPSTYAMMLAGAGVLVWFGRRKPAQS